MVTITCAIFWDFIAVSLQICASWYETPCSLLYTFQRFWEHHFIHVQGITKTFSEPSLITCQATLCRIPKQHNMQYNYSDSEVQFILPFPLCTNWTVTVSSHSGFSETVFVSVLFRTKTRVCKFSQKFYVQWNVLQRTNATANSFHP